MAKYKLLDKECLPDPFWVIGEVYDSQLRRHPAWTDRDTRKMVIINKGNKIIVDVRCDSVSFLTFKTAELRDEFLKNFEPLIKQYFMID